MKVIEVVILFISICIGVICIILERHAKRTADLLTERDLAYENEKGKNLATKEDVEAITKQVEEVKSVVTLYHQKRFDQLAEQERILLEILYDATKISQSQNKIVLYFYDTSSRKRYDNLVESVNDTLAHFYHLCNIATISIPIEGIAEQVGDLSVATTNLGFQVSVAATNASSLVDQFNNQMDHAMKMADNDPSKSVWLSNGLQTKRQIESMRGKPIEGRDELNKAIEKYCEWLKQLYGKDVFVFKS